MKNKLLTAILLLFPLMLHAQGIGQWTAYTAYRNAQLNVPAGNLVFATFGGNLLSYDPADGDVRFFSRADGLNGKDIALLGYASTRKAVVLVYADCNIDVLYTDDDGIANLRQLKDNAAQTGTPTCLSINGDYACIGTTKGVALIDLANLLVHGFYPKSTQVTAAAFLDGLLYAATADARVQAAPLSANVYDETLWTTVFSRKTTALQPFAGGLYAVTEGSGLWHLTKDGDGTHTARQATTRQFTGLYAPPSGTVCVGFNSGGIAVFDAANPLAPSRETDFTNTWKCLTRTPDGTFRASDGANGLVSYALQGNTLVQTGNVVGGYGPQNDNCGFLRFAGTRLLVSGGRHDYYESTFYEPAAACYDGDDRWQFLQTEGIEAQNHLLYRSVTSMAQDPADPNHHFTATGDYGLYEFRNGSFVKCYNVENSPLRSFYNNLRSNVRIDGLTYDAQGNLWMTNQITDTILRILRPDGTWAAIYNADIARARHIHPLLFDTEGRLWAASRNYFGTQRGGLLMLDYGGTIGNTSDDTSVFRYQMTNEDGVPIDLSGGVYCMAQDKDGQIWFGAGAGLFVVEDPSAYASSTFTVLQVKVPRNDGTNYADYLLDGVPCTAICIDGANRKWIGTGGQGLYLVSPSGQEIIRQFTTADSPLLSDNILALAAHPTTGEIFIGTDKGLISYHSEATEAADRLSEDNVRVWPNPVRPDFQGSVVVSGLTDAADVKIMTTGGQAVAAGTSTGGTFTWDVRNFRGERVASGIYYLLISTADGKEHIAAKIAVVR